MTYHDETIQSLFAPIACQAPRSALPAQSHFASLARLERCLRSIVQTQLQEIGLTSSNQHETIFVGQTSEPANLMTQSLNHQME